ncbi:MAG: hypothetical protein ABSC21_17515 [Terriglobia bacterium]
MGISTVTGLTVFPIYIGIELGVPPPSLGEEDRAHVARAHAADDAKTA